MRDNVGYPDQLEDEKHLEDMFNKVKEFSPSRFVIIVFNCYLDTTIHGNNL